MQILIQNIIYHICGRISNPCWRHNANSLAPAAFCRPQTVHETIAVTQRAYPYIYCAGSAPCIKNAAGRIHRSIFISLCFQFFPHLAVKRSRLAVQRFVYPAFFQHVLAREYQTVLLYLLIETFECRGVRSRIAVSPQSSSPPHPLCTENPGTPAHRRGSCLFSS